MSAVELNANVPAVEFHQRQVSLQNIYLIKIMVKKYNTDLQLLLTYMNNTFTFRNY